MWGEEGESGVRWIRDVVIKKYYSIYMYSMSV